MRKRQIRKQESDFNIGDMNERVLIQSPVNIPNGQGGISKGWTDYETVWASIRSDRNSWIIQQNMKTTADYKSFIIWYDENIVKGMRIVWNNLSYLILNIIDYDSARRYLRLECEGNKIDG